MAEMLSPGVYTTEIDQSEYVSESSTCIIGLVGGARRGPVGVPTLVTTQAQLINTFGKPVEGEYGIYSALAALTQASQVWYTRVVRGGIKASCGTLGTDKILYKAKEQGETFNGIKIEQTELVEDKFNIVIKDKEDTQLETYENLTLVGTDENYVETIVNTQSHYITASVQYSGTVKAITFTLEGGSGSGTYSRAGVEGENKITFRSKYYDSDLNGCSVVISAVDNYGFFDITIKNGDELIESWESLSMSVESDRYVELVINSSDSSRIVCAVNTTNAELELEECTLTFSGGDNGINGISVDDIIGEETGSGLYSFSNPEAVDIDLLATSGWTDVKVINAGISIAENRESCLYIADAPFGLTPQEVMEWSNGTGQLGGSAFDSSYGALYWSWLKVSDSYTRKNIWLPPSGYVMAQYAYNDNNGFPWYAPAGLIRGNITKAIGIEYNPTKGERDAIYGNRNIVNPIANQLGNGVVIWGQKTMQRKPSSLDRVNVRRMVNYLKKTITNATKYFVFEQNIEATWEKWENTVDPILANVKNNNGIYDYKIVINPSDSDIENSRMPVAVAIKPTKTAEFIPLTFNIMPYTASFDN